MYRKLRKTLLAFCLYCAAILLLFEEWIWQTSRRVLARLPTIPIFARAEVWISGLSPYAALTVLIAPIPVLLPVKILALLLISRGHPALGLCVILIAKVIGTALAARLYSLTRHTLLSLSWFLRCHDMVQAYRRKLLTRLVATRSWRQIATTLAALSAFRKKIGNAVRQFRRNDTHGLHRLARLVNKYAARRRDRH